MAASGDEDYTIGDVAEITVRVDDNELTYDGMDALVEDLGGLTALGYAEDDGFDGFSVEIDGVEHAVETEEAAAEYLEAAIEEYGELEAELEDVEEEKDELQDMLQDTMSKNQALIKKLQNDTGQRKEYQEQIDQLQQEKEQLEDKLEAIGEQPLKYGTVEEVLEGEQALKIDADGQSYPLKTTVDSEMYEEAEEGDVVEMTTKWASDKWSPLSIAEKASERSTEYAVAPEDLGDVSIDDVGGLDEEYEEMTRTVTLQNVAPGLYSDEEGEAVLDSAGGMLLHGPPGTGKTLLTRAMASEQDMNLFIIKGPEIMDKWVGKAEEKVRDVSQAAKNAAEDGTPSMVVFDELDSIAQERESGGSNNVGDRVVGQLLSEMDGMEEYGDVYWVATSNQPDIIDPALKRDSRLGKHIEVSRPGREATQQIAEIYMPDGVAEQVTETIGQYDDLEEPQINSGDKISAIAQEATESFLMDRIREGEDVPEQFQQENVDQSILEEIPAEYWDEAVESLYDEAVPPEPDSVSKTFQ